MRIGIFLSKYVYKNHFFQYTDYDIALFSLDNGKTKFFDLLQMIEFYQLNQVPRKIYVMYYRPVRVCAAKKCTMYMHWAVSEKNFLFNKIL